MFHEDSDGNWVGGKNVEKSVFWSKLHRKMGTVFGQIFDPFSSAVGPFGLICEFRLINSYFFYPFWPLVGHKSKKIFSGS